MKEQDKMYYDYVLEHINNVKKGFEYFVKKGNGKVFKLNEKQIKDLKNQIDQHDASKFENEEFYPYSDFFFGEKTEEVKNKFKIAVKLHKSRNSHHPEYWTDKNGIQDMPFDKILEMVCDWWSFGIKQKDYFEIFKFYENNRHKFNFSKQTQTQVDNLLAFIKESNPVDEDFKSIAENCKQI